MKAITVQHSGKCKHMTFLFSMKRQSCVFRRFYVKCLGKDQQVFLHLAPVIKMKHLY